MHYLKTTSFRTTLIYMVLFSLSALLVITLIYVQTTNLLRQELDTRVALEAERLQMLYVELGESELRRDIDRSGDDPRAAIYWLADNMGVKIAGNLDRIPSLKSSRSFDENWVEFYFLDADQKATIRGQFIDLSDQLRLFVGRDLAARDRIAASFIQSAFIAVLLIIVLGVAGGIIIARNMQNRLGRINHAAMRIMEGDLEQRIDVGASNDEFDTLARNLNMMLDRISELLTAMRDVSENIAHDLRTPLNRLRARLDVINTHVTREGYQVSGEDIEGLQGEIDNVLLTFSALLSLARLESGAAPLLTEDVDLSLLVRELASLYEPLVEETGADMTLWVPDEPLMILASRPLLSQAIGNLIENACKYALAPNRHLNIRLSRAQNTISLLVEDDGPGIPEGDFDRALRRFGRLDESRAMPGNGLGLPLVYAIIVRHGGTMSLERATIGGLAVRIDFPIHNLIKQE